MNIQIKYGFFINLLDIAEAAYMFVDQINDALKELKSIPNMQFHSHNHLVQMVMFHAGMPMCEASYADVESYFGDGVGAILRDFGHERD